MEHIHKYVHELGKFEVTLDPLIQPGNSYKVQVTNEVNCTYFGGPLWSQVVGAYEMYDGEKCVFYLDRQIAPNIYFFYKDSKYSEEDPRVDAEDDEI